MFHSLYSHFQTVFLHRKQESIITNYYQCTTKKKTIVIWGCRDGSVVQGTGYSSRVPGGGGNNLVLQTLDKDLRARTAFLRSSSKVDEATRSQSF